MSPRGTLTALAALTAPLALFACSEVPTEETSPESEGPMMLRQAGTPGAIVVRQTNRGPVGWQFIEEGGPSPVGELVEGPGDPPLREGSARFALASGTEAMSLQNFNPRFVGARLDEIDELTYCTYVESAPGSQAVALQLNFDDDVTDGDDSWKGRIVFEPVNNVDQGAVTNNEWQCWDAINGGDAKWWATGAPASAECPNAAPFCTWDDLLNEFPNAGINSKFGGILLKAGSGWSFFDGNADALTIVLDGAQTRYDFEAPRASGGRP